mgnify:CR=1 FL=1|tara:strand:+ start:529 stop:879 length:351 start_codon:yes stop_codon:yes gene_type:complete
MDVYELGNIEVTVYGYINIFREKDYPGFGYWLDLDDGKNKDETLWVEINYQTFHKPNESIASAKRRAYLPIRNAKNKEGWKSSYLLELKGKFSLYSDMEKVFLNPKEIRMIPEFNK